MGKLDIRWMVDDPGHMTDPAEVRAYLAGLRREKDPDDMIRMSIKAGEDLLADLKREAADDRAGRLERKSA